MVMLGFELRPWRCLLHLGSVPQEMQIYNIEILKNECWTSSWALLNRVWNTSGCTDDMVTADKRLPLITDASAGGKHMLGDAVSNRRGHFYWLRPNDHHGGHMFILLAASQII